MATREYSNGEITIEWDSDKCAHVSFCWQELPEVFRPQERPWVHPECASTERIIEQIERCPTGALGYHWNTVSERS